MYRAVTLKVLQGGIPLQDDARIVAAAEAAEIAFLGEGVLPKVLLDGNDVTEAIRSQEVSAAVSRVSSIAGVRKVMVSLQRSLASAGGVVVDGRDIGTVVLPHADLKIFMVADVAERARRRQKDLNDSGLSVDAKNVEQDLERRDHLDSTRAVSPLRKAADAIELDTTRLSFDEQVAWIVDQARALSERKG